MAKQTVLKDDHHVARHVGDARLIRDKVTGRIIRCVAQAFAYRETDGEINPTLSATWLERFSDHRPEQLRQVLAAMRADQLTVGGRSALAIGNVGEIKDAGTRHGVKLKIHNEPSKMNPGYAPIRGIPREADELLELLAAEIFADIAAVAEIDGIADKRPL